MIFGVLLLLLKWNRVLRVFGQRRRTPRTFSLLSSEHVQQVKKSVFRDVMTEMIYGSVSNSPAKPGVLHLFPFDNSMRCVKHHLVLKAGWADWESFPTVTVKQFRPWECQGGWWKREEEKVELTIHWPDSARAIQHVSDDQFSTCALFSSSPSLLWHSAFFLNSPFFHFVWWWERIQPHK